MSSPGDELLVFFCLLTFVLVPSGGPSTDQGSSGRPTEAEAPGSGRNLTHFDLVPGPFVPKTMTPRHQWLQKFVFVCVCVCVCVCVWS